MAQKTTVKKHAGAQLNHREVFSPEFLEVALSEISEQDIIKLEAKPSLETTWWKKSTNVLVRWSKEIAFGVLIGVIVTWIL